MRISTRSEQRFELEKHLHEQYAINNNAHTASFISFVAALLVLFGAFGYVYAHTINAWSVSKYEQLSQTDSAYVLIPVQSNDHQLFIPQKDLYTLDQFLLLAFVVSGVLFFLACLSLQLGYAQRRDQVIVQNIRKKYECDIITYSDAKEKDNKNFIQDYYQLFFYLFLIAQGFVITACILKFICYGIWLPCIIMLVFIQLLGIMFPFCRRKKLYKKYCKRANKQFMKGKDYKVYKMVRTNPYGKSWCLECSDPNLDREALAIFNSIEYVDIFGEYKKNMKPYKQRLSVVRISNDDRKIYRKFQSHSITGLGNDCIGISPNSFTELGLEEKGNQCVRVKKSYWLPFFWYHSNSATRVSFRFGLMALIVGIIGCILTIVV